MSSDNRWNLRTLIATATFCSATLASATAFAYSGIISDGSYVSMSFNDGTGAGQTGSYATNGGILSYTNQIPTAIDGQFGIIGDGSAEVATYASVATGTLNLLITPSLVSSSAVAELWDSITFGNLPPTGPNVTVNTQMGTINLTVTTTAPATDTPALIQSAIGLQLYGTSGFLPTLGTGTDCGLTVYACLGLITSSTNGGTVSLQGNAVNSVGVALGAQSYTYSVPVTLGQALSGVSFLAEIAATTTGSGQTFSIDPSISLTNLYSGITINGASGINYTAPAPVPVPAAAWLLGSGLLGLFGISRGRRELAIDQPSG
jgi:hypothetical protein